ncbi:hypothetical protein ABBQ38_001407 [Trebouxia sp. C0009 RCD-2024]
MYQHWQKSQQPMQICRFVADETDGRFARKYDQTSTLGAVLDMVTDRVSTAGLLMLLCKTYPDLFILFLLLLMLDLFSHWFQMYSTLVAGSATHKDKHSESFLVRLYYQKRIFMGFCCVSCEVLYLMSFLCSQPDYQRWVLLPISLPTPIAAVLPGAQKAGQMPLVAFIGLMALPGVLTKQFVNCVQLKNAMASLVAHDEQKGQPGKSQ